MRFIASILAAALMISHTAAVHNVRSSAATSPSAGARRRLACDPDTESPVASCKQAFDLNVDATIAVGDIDMGSADTCDTSAAPVLVDEPITGTCELFIDGAPIDVEIMIMDTSGNDASCKTAVTVVDQNPPTATCGDFEVELSSATEAGSASIAASDIDNESSDDCTAVTLSVAPMTFGCGDVGMNSVTLTVMDTSLNPATCTAEVAVTETTPPVLTCSSVNGQTFNLATGTNTITVPNTATATDNCDTDVMITPAEFTYGCDDVGEQSATITAEDDQGNSAECEVTNTVRDDEPPTIACTTDTITKKLSSIDAVVLTTEVVMSATDNCNSLTTVFESSGAGSVTYTCADVGMNTEKVTTTDESSNVAECMVAVMIEDKDAPDADCMDASVRVDASGVAVIAPADVDGGSDDNCGTVSLEVDISSAGCSDIGTPVEVFLTATDGAGMTAACAAKVTVLDDTPPMATMCDAVTLSLGSSSTVTLATSSFAATDNCGGAVTTTLSKSTFACGESGPITVTFTDEYSNQSTCNPTVNVDACPNTPTASPVATPTDTAPAQQCDLGCMFFQFLCTITLGFICL